MRATGGWVIGLVLLGGCIAALLTSQPRGIHVSEWGNLGSEGGIALLNFVRGDRPHVNREDVLSTDDIEDRFGPPRAVEVDGARTGRGPYLHWTYPDAVRGEVTMTFIHVVVPTCSAQLQEHCSERAGFQGWFLWATHNDEAGP